MRRYKPLANSQLEGLLTAFIEGRRQGLSKNTIQFYRSCLKPFVKGYELTPAGINRFLSELTCSADMVSAALYMECHM